MDSFRRKFLHVSDADRTRAFGACLIEYQTRLLAAGVKAADVALAAEYLTHASLADIVLERSIRRLCGFPCCSVSMVAVAPPSTAELVAAAKHGVLSATDDRRHYCSLACHKSNNALASQISVVPPLARISSKESFAVNVGTFSQSRGPPAPVVRTVPQAATSTPVIERKPFDVVSADAGCLGPYAASAVEGFVPRVHLLVDICVPPSVVEPAVATLDSHSRAGLGAVNLSANVRAAARGSAARVGGGGRDAKFAERRERGLRSTSSGPATALRAVDAMLQPAQSTRVTPAAPSVSESDAAVEAMLLPAHAIADIRRHRNFFAHLTQNAIAADKVMPAQFPSALPSAPSEPSPEDAMSPRRVHFVDAAALPASGEEAEEMISVVAPAEGRTAGGVACIPVVDDTAGGVALSDGDDYWKAYSFDDEGGMEEDSDEGSGDSDAGDEGDDGDGIWAHADATAQDAGPATDGNAVPSEPSTSDAAPVPAATTSAPVAVSSALLRAFGLGSFGVLAACVTAWRTDPATAIALCASDEELAALGGRDGASGTDRPAPPLPFSLRGLVAVLPASADASCSAASSSSGGTSSRAPGPQLQQEAVRVGRREFILAQLTQAAAWLLLPHSGALGAATGGGSRVWTVASGPGSVIDRDRPSAAAPPSPDSPIDGTSQPPLPPSPPPPPHETSAVRLAAACAFLRSLAASFSVHAPVPDLDPHEWRLLAAVALAARDCVALAAVEGGGRVTALALQADAAVRTRVAAAVAAAWNDDDDDAGPAAALLSRVAALPSATARTAPGCRHPSALPSASQLGLLQASLVFGVDPPGLERAAPARGGAQADRSGAPAVACTPQAIGIVPQQRRLFGDAGDPVMLAAEQTMLAAVRGGRAPGY